MLPKYAYIPDVALRGLHLNVSKYDQHGVCVGVCIYVHIHVYIPKRRVPQRRELASGFREKENKHPEKQHCFKRLRKGYVPRATSLRVQGCIRSDGFSGLNGYVQKPPLPASRVLHKGYIRQAPGILGSVKRIHPKIACHFCFGVGRRYFDITTGM